MLEGHVPAEAEPAIKRAVRIAGGQVALAKRLTAGEGGCDRPITQQAVSHWVCCGHVPAHLAFAVSEITGGRVPAAQLIDPALQRILQSMIPSQAQAA